MSFTSKNELIMNTTTEEIAAAGVRERLAKYQNECKTKAVKPTIALPTVAPLEKELTDGSKFVASPSKIIKKKVLLDPGKLTDSAFDYSVRFDYDPSEYSDTEKDFSERSSLRTATVGTLRPGMMRGSSFDDDDEEEEPDLSDIYGTIIGCHPPDMGLRPGMFRGDSFDEQPPVTEEEENDAKGQVVGMLNSMDANNQIEAEKVDFLTVKDNYLGAIATLRPESIDVSAPSYTALSKEEQRKQKRAHLQGQQKKMNQFEDLKTNWICYETVAQDKPEFPSEVADGIQEKEEGISEEWAEFADKVVEDVQDNSDSETDDDEDDLAYWIAEAKRLRVQKDRRSKAKRRVRRVMRKEKNEKLMQEEDADIVEAALKLKAEADSKSGKKQNQDDGKKQNQDESDSDDSIDDITGQLEKKKGNPGAFLDDSSGDDSDDSGVGMAKSYCKTKAESSFSTREAFTASLGSLGGSQKSLNSSRKSIKEDSLDPLESLSIPPPETKSGSDEADVLGLGEKVGAGGNSPKAKNEKGTKSTDKNKLVEIESSSGSGGVEPPKNSKKKVARKSKSMRNFKEEDLANQSDEEPIKKGKTKNKNTTKKAKSERFAMTKDSDSDSDSDSDDSNNASPKKSKKKSKNTMKKAKSERFAMTKDSDSDSDSDSDDSGNASPKKSKKKSKNTMKKAKSERFAMTKDSDSDSDSDSDDSGNASPKKSKKKSKVAKKKNTKSKQGKSSGLTKDRLELTVMPLKNLDGSDWKNNFKAWMNQPKKVKIEGTCITVRVPEKTDCWRKTRHNFIMDNAPFYWHKVAGDFEVMCKISGGLSSMYDKAGLMIRLDEENWISSGMECFNNTMNHSTCITKDHTDWSLAPLPMDSEKNGTWFAIKRIGDSIETFYSLEGKKWIQTRQSLFNTAPILKVGIFCASPMGDPFKVNFDMYRCKNI